MDYMRCKIERLERERDYLVSVIREVKSSSYNCRGELIATSRIVALCDSALLAFETDK